MIKDGHLMAVESTVDGETEEDKEVAHVVNI